MLASIDWPDYKVQKMTSWLTQDKAHLLMDLEVSARTLREDIQERLWLTLRLEDLKVKNQVSLNDTELYTDDKISIQPLGVDEVLTYQVFDRYSQGNILVSPGTDLVFAKYRNRQIRSNWTVNVSINMVTGEVSYLKPPKKAMIESPENVLQKGSTPDDIKKYDGPSWLTRKYEDYKTNIQEEDFEELIYYSEKDKTYMTWSHIPVPETAGFQLVFENGKNEIISRMPIQGSGTNLNMSKYTIRKIGTDELISEYTLIASLARKISHDGKYMVSMEGESQVLTLRDRLTGKLIDTAPRARMNNVYEVPSGFVLKHKLKQDIGYSLLSNGTEPTASTAGSGNSTNATPGDYGSKFDSFPRKYQGTYGGVTTDYDVFTFSLALVDQSKLDQLKPKEEVGMLIIEHPQMGKSYSELTLKENKKGNLVLINRKHSGDEEFRKKTRFFYLKLKATKDPSELKASTFEFGVLTSKHSIKMMAK